MIIGIDFDNTLVSYDRLFHHAAREARLIPRGLPATKIAVREHLRRTGREDAWTELQGMVYGPRLEEARPFPGAKDFIAACESRGIAVCIISHRTRRPHRGPPHDLHAAARRWVGRHLGLAPARVFFEVTPAAKRRRIRLACCTHFIDDLPEFLRHPAFPGWVHRMLFDPGGSHGSPGGLAAYRSWPALRAGLLGSEPAAGATDAIEGAAVRMLRRIGRQPDGPLRTVPGGANNRAYEMADSRGKRYFLKEYFRGAAGSRDRFGSERSFYRYLRAAGSKFVPRDYSWDRAARAGLLEFVGGRRLKPQDISATEVGAALSFLAQLNDPRRRRSAASLPDATEACFSLTASIQVVEKRLCRLESLPTTGKIDSQAAAFVRNRLRPAWQTIRSGLRRRVGRLRVPTAERCVSPADFGFHNALRRPDGRLVFFDFEHAGWDDPAKMVCDFFCQPALPVAADHFDGFAREVAGMLGLKAPEKFARRCRCLWPMFQLKWCCILLNEFLPAEQSRRAFALGQTPADRIKARQLSKARRALDRISHLLTD